MNAKRWKDRPKAERDGIAQRHADYYRTRFGAKAQEQVEKIAESGYWRHGKRAPHLDAVLAILKQQEDKERP